MARLPALDASAAGAAGVAAAALHFAGALKSLPGLAALEAVVAWRDKFKYGCAFAKPLHPAVFDHIVALSKR